MIVMKFGGSSIGEPTKVNRCIELVNSQIKRKPIVVVSAHGKTTDALIDAAGNARKGAVSFTKLENFHLDLISELKLDPQIITPLLEQLAALLQGVSLLGELTKRTQDKIMSYGERLSSRIMAAAMSACGIKAVAVNSFDIGLATNNVHGGATPLEGIESAICKNLISLDEVPVVTGFLGCSPSGDVTTLGRSGSDFSASIIGAAVDAEEVQIWTDVNGVMTCDPSIDNTAKNLPVLSFDEASELAYYGAEVLHPNTLVPAIKKNIPVRVLNTMRPQDSGTVVVSKTACTDRIAKSVVYKEDVCLINLASPRLMSAVKLLSAAFDVLTENGVGIHMANTSEATVSLVTDKNYSNEILDMAMEKLKKLGQVEIEKDKSIICVVGEELKGQVGVVASIFETVAAQGIKAKMVSQSASELNIAFLVDNAEIEPVVCALHKLILGS